MATITSAASGNWSDTATWVGGVVPTTSDDVVLNNHKVVADVDIEVLSIYANAGILEVSTNRTISLTGTGLSVNDGFSSSGIGGINITGSGITVTINSELTTGTARAAINIAGGTNTVNVNGDATCRGTAGSPTNAAVVNMAGANNELNYTGNVSNSSITASEIIGAFTSSAAGNSVNFVGNVFNGTYPTFLNRGSGVFSISIIGTITGSSKATVINNNESSSLQIIGTVNQSGTINPFYCRNIDFTLGSYWQLPTANLYTLDQGALGQAAESDVRKDVVYGPSNELTGELEPVNVDTAQLASDLLNDIQTSSHVVAQRLRAAATDDSVGDIVASTLGA